MNHWLVKTEPDDYSIQDFQRDQVTCWDGVRNALAQQYLRQMETGDQVLIYHSGKDKAVMGLAEVVREKYLDPGDDNGKSVCVDLKFVDTLEHPVPLSSIKESSALRDIGLVRISRLSVMPVNKTQWRTLMELADKAEKHRNAESRKN